mgnify:CR=1 FL=1
MNTETREYNVYIDESGDEGIKKGSKYFILTAIIVNKEEDLVIAKNVDIIKQNLEINIKNQLHWKLLKGRPNKIMIMETISKLNIKIITIYFRFLISKNKYDFLHKKVNGIKNIR